MTPTKPLTVVDGETTIHNFTALAVASRAPGYPQDSHAITPLRLILRVNPHPFSKTVTQVEKGDV